MKIQAPLPREAFFHYHCEFDAIGLIEKFAANAEAVDGHTVNFLGVIIPVAVHRALLTPLINKVEPIPIPSNWHACMAEWAAALKSVDVAKDTYRILEVGCGWGCWMTNMGVAARSAGLSVQLVGIDGARNHLKNAHRTLRLNNFPDTQIKLICGVAAPHKGKAIFPENRGYGAEPIFNPTGAELAAAEKSAELTVLNKHTLSSLADGETFDLVHIDIQGSEVDFIKANFDELEVSANRVLIGTHSRQIDGALMQLFLEAGWSLEMERPAILQFVDGQPQVKIDGVQLWRNLSQ